MTIFGYDDPIISQRRKGTQEDPFININEAHTVENGKVILTELPHEFNKVQVTGEGRNWHEISGGIPSNNQYRVDYKNKIVTFNQENNGLQLNFSYVGTGLHYAPTSMIYTKRNNGEVTETLKEFIDTGDEKIEEISLKISETQNKIEEADSKITETEQVRSDTEQTRQDIIADYDEVVTQTKVIILPFVESYEDIGTTYPNPQLGWTVQVNEDGIEYRFDGAEWKPYRMSGLISGGEIVSGEIPPENVNVIWLDTSSPVTKFRKYNPSSSEWEEIKPVTKFDTYKNHVTISSSTAMVNIGIPEFNRQDDVLLVTANTISLTEGEEYTIHDSGVSIVKSSGSWNAGTVFGFTVLKTERVYHEYSDGTLIQPGSITDNQLAEGIRISPSLEDSNGNVHANLRDRLFSVDDQLAQTEQNVNQRSINVKTPPIPLVGMKGDGTTRDDVAFKNLGNFAVTNGISKIEIPEGEYRGEKAFLFHSRITYEGTFAKTRFIQENGNEPVIASANYMEKYSPTGRVIIRNIRLKGNINNSNNHGVLLRDYFSRLENVIVEECGGDGFRLTDRDIDGTTVGGTLVENFLFQCEARRVGGIPFNLGANNNNKLTDGYLLNCIASATETSPAHLYLGSAAGWVINGLHTYGHHAPQTSVHILNAYHTNIDNIYIEGFKDNGLYCASVQRSVNIGNVSVKCDDVNTDGRALRFTRSSLVQSAAVNIANVVIHQSTERNVVGIHSDTSTLHISTVNIQTEGTKRSFIRKFQSPTKETIKRVDDAAIDGAVRETANNIGMTYQGVGMAHYANSDTVSGGSSVSRTFKLSRIRSFKKIIGTLSICASAFDDGAKRADFVASVMVSAKNNDNDNWTAYVTNIVSPTGFSVNPSVSVNHTGNGEGTMTVTFTFTNSDARGVIGFVYAPSE